MDLTGLMNVEDPDQQPFDEQMHRNLMQIYGPVQGDKIFRDFLLKRAQEQQKQIMGNPLNGSKKISPNP